MYIVPNTDVRLLHNVNIDNSYKHTIYFDNNTEQANYFIGKTKYNLTNYSYQRYNKGLLKVGIKADSLYDCNYMMFRNKNFGNKWFYAFVNEVVYVSNDTAEVHYEIDVMQTWMFECQLEMCFVEREHSLTDNIGDNYVPENVNTGEYYVNSFENMFTNLEKLVVVVLVADADLGGTLLDGIYSGCTAHCFKVDSDVIGNLNEFIKGYTDNPENIVSIYMCPLFNAGGVIEDTGTVLDYSKAPENTRVASYQINDSYTLNGYKPKNKKLYTYPYNFFNVVDGNGGSLITRYEFCNNLTPEYTINGTITPPVQTILRPFHYKGMTQYNELLTESLVLNNYPQCSFVIDSFKAWLAQEAVPQIMDFGLDTVSGLATGGLGYGVGRIGRNSVYEAGNLISQGYKASIRADIVKGSVNHGSVNCATGKQTFWGYRMSVTNKNAKIIDDYFNKFGYATNEVKIPNTHSRPHWNYVKCVDATVIGNCPSDDCTKIESIYNNGITFWKNGEEVGNYSLDNSPT